MLQYKAFTEFKFLDQDTGGFEGYASLFGVLDQGGDVVEAGAFADTLDGFVKDGFIASGHDWDGLPIGSIADAREDERGLFIRAEYHSTAMAQEARRVANERMARGKSVGLSIGYAINPGGEDYDTTGVRHLRSLKLFEISQVNVPMLTPAGLTAVKNATYAEHSDRVLTDVRTLVERSQEIADLRMKEGRVLSASNRAKLADLVETLSALAAVKDDIEVLLRDTEPAKALDTRALFADYLRIEARLNGVAA